MKNISLTRYLFLILLLAALVGCTLTRSSDPGTADNNGSFIGGGIDNQAHEEAVVGGGASNQAGGFRSVVGGGSKNHASNAYTTICGGADNSASGSRATIAGGVHNTASAFDATIGGGSGNLARSRGAFVGGGGGNTAGQFAVVAGGLQNQAERYYASVCGGVNNLANGIGAFVGGGSSNQAQGSNVTISGGLANMASGSYSTIAGGRNNQADGHAAAIPGGEGNRAGGDYSLAAGSGAIIRTDHPGTFLFADTSLGDFFSESANEFAVRATGGVRFVTAIDNNGAPLSGAYLAAGSGSWSVLSDRQAKVDLLPTDGKEILAKLTQLPVNTWRYRSQSEKVRHIGPSAQDFYTVFGLGEDDRHISTVDADGVALAALGEAARLLNAQEKQIADLSARLDALEQNVPNAPTNNHDYDHKFRGISGFGQYGPRAPTTDLKIASLSLLIGILVGWKIRSTTGIRPRGVQMPDANQEGRGRG